MNLQVAAAIAANRFGLGARPGELERIGREPRGWLQAQLAGGAPWPADEPLPGSREILLGAEPLMQERRAAGPARRLPEYLRGHYVDEARARLRTALRTERPFTERLVHFWGNHFAVSADKFVVLALAGSFEREAIRPHLTGNFRELLFAAESHPAMLLYLDNQRSTGPDSPLAQRAAGRGRTLGLNENLAREILELHTVGVDAGYTQADVTAFARVLTGWSVGGGPGDDRQDAGLFRFRTAMHEPGTARILGRRYTQDDRTQGLAVLSDLAAKPATARHIAVKLARHFIRDDPPDGAVERITHAFERSGGELDAVYAALIEAPEAWREGGGKFKSPEDYVHSIGRALALPPQSAPQLLGALELLGQRTFTPGSPADWPDRSADWDGASELMKRIELADATGRRLGDRYDARQLAPQLLGATLSPATSEHMAHAASPAQALTLLLTAPEFMRR